MCANIKDPAKFETQFQQFLNAYNILLIVIWKWTTEVYSNVINDVSV